MEPEGKIIELKNIDAVIFDMDGVVAETIPIYAAAWKQLFDEYLLEHAYHSGDQYRLFETDLDYFRYIDGKSRYDGVQSFLNSRNISLPRGEQTDAPYRETIYGLGSRVNQYFLRLLKQEGVTAYRSLVGFIRKLKSRGTHTAVVSDFRNSDEILESAAVLDLFDVKINGVDVKELKLKGKPHPDVFKEAAKRLDVPPERAAILGDVLASVKAGHRGNFALVIGLDRTGHGENLVRNGANVVVTDLSLLKLKPFHRSKLDSYQANKPPLALKRQQEIFGRLVGKNIMIFLDYDGTLTPIVLDPVNAVLSDQTRQVIKRLARYYSVAIISGRDLNDVRQMVGIDDIAYAGSHGFDIMGPHCSFHSRERGEEFLPVLDCAEKELRAVLKNIEGVYVERKRFAIAVHYRRVNNVDVDKLKNRFDRAASRSPKLRKTSGKKVLELLPNVNWDKGKALLAMLEVLCANRTKIVPLYIGDDITDEDAFCAVKNHGIGIVVGTSRHKTLAQYRLRNTNETREFLEGLVALAEKERL